MSKLPAMNSLVAPFRVPRLDRPFDVQITLPGSKSIALRHLAMAALHEGETIIRGVPPCDDTDAMMACLSALGVTVEQQSNTVSVRGPMDFTADVELNAHMSGASTRLLIGLAALRSGQTRIDGHESLRVRTNRPLYDVLEQNGCRVKSSGGLPVVIQGPFSPGGVIAIDGSLSSQYVTAILTVAPAMAPGRSQVIELTGDLVSSPYIGITINEMRKRGISAIWEGSRIDVSAGHYTGGAVEVEGDATAATYFSGLATLHSSRVTLTNLGSATVQGDYAFHQTMAALGAEITATENTTTISGPAELKALPELDFEDMPDAALTLIAMGPLLPGGLRLTGLSSLHHKECDRLECPAHELRAMGVSLETGSESIRIEPADSFNPHELTTYHDHRMAMAFSLPGSVYGDLTIDDAAVVNKTYPDYWNDFERLRVHA